MFSLSYLTWCHHFTWLTLPLVKQDLSTQHDQHCFVCMVPRDSGRHTLLCFLTCYFETLSTVATGGGSLQKRHTHTCRLTLFLKGKSIVKKESSSQKDKAHGARHAPGSKASFWKTKLAYALVLPFSISSKELSNSKSGISEEQFLNEPQWEMMPPPY